MSAYGDYASTCPRTFQKGFTVLQSFDGGYIAKVPEMVSLLLLKLEVCVLRKERKPHPSSSNHIFACITTWPKTPSA